MNEEIAGRGGEEDDRKVNGRRLRRKRLLHADVNGAPWRERIKGVRWRWMGGRCLQMTPFIDDYDADDVGDDDDGDVDGDKRHLCDPGGNKMLVYLVLGSDLPLSFTSVISRPPRAKGGSKGEGGRRREEEEEAKEPFNASHYTASFSFFFFLFLCVSICVVFVCSTVIVF